VAEAGAHEEAVELGLGQLVGARLLDRVLGGDHHERTTHVVGPAVDGDVALLHHLEQRRLGLGRGTVDLVGKDDAVEDGSGVEGELAVGLVVDSDAGDVGRQQVRGELDAGERALQGLRQRPGHHRLARARQVLEQEVPARDQAGERQSHDVPLAQHRRLDVAHDPVEGVGVPADVLGVEGRDVSHVVGQPPLVSGRPTGCSPVGRRRG
jgi:hypothetical protein